MSSKAAGDDCWGASVQVKMAKPQIQQDKAGFGDMGRGGGFGGQGKPPIHHSSVC